MQSVSLINQVNGWKRSKCVTCLRFTKPDPDGFMCKCGQRYLPDPEIENNYLVVPNE